MRSAVLLVACVTLGAATPAAADSAADALALARQGEDAAARGDFTGAVARFKQALALDSRPEYQCNVGVAYYKGGDLPRAQLFLSLCLTRGSHLDATFLDAVRGVLVAVEDTLRAGEFTPIDVVVTPASAELTVSAFAADEVIVGSRLLWLPVGAHTLTVAANGYVSASVPVEASGHEPVRVPVSLEKVKIADPIVPVTGVTKTTVVDRRRGWRRAAWTGTGVSGVAAILTAVQYVRARAATREAGAEPPGLGYEEAVQDAEQQIRTFYLAAGVTAVCAAVTGALWWQSRPRERLVISGAPTEGGAAVWLGGTF